MGELAEFWAGARAGELRLPWCRTCLHSHWYPEPRCPHCAGLDLGWRQVRPSGRVFTSTIVRRTLSIEAGPELPIVVLLVELDDAPGCRLVLNRADGLVEHLPIGTPVDVVFVEAGPSFVPVAKLHDAAPIVVVPDGRRPPQRTRYSH